MNESIPAADSSNQGVPSLNTFEDHSLSNMDKYRAQLSERLTPEMPQPAPHGAGFSNMHMRNTQVAGDVIPMLGSPMETNENYAKNQESSFAKQRLIEKGLGRSIGSWNPNPPATSDFAAKQLHNFLLKGPM